MSRFAVCCAGIMAGLVALVAFSNRSGTEFHRPVSPTHDPLSSLVDPAELDFGDVWAQPAFPWQLTLRNFGDERLELADIESSCRCTSLEPRSGVLPPRGALPLQLVLDLRPAEGDRLPQEFTVDLHLKLANDSNDLTETVTVRGRVLPNPIDVDPHDLALAEIVRSDPSTYDRSITLRSTTARLATSAAAVPAGQAQVRLVSIEAQPGEQQVRVAIDRHLPRGPLALQIQLSYPAEGDRPARLLNLALRGEVVEDVEPIPGTVLLGALTVGEPFEEYVTFRSRTGRIIQSVEAVEFPERFAVQLIRENKLPDREVAARLTGSLSDVGEQTHALQFRFEVEGLHEAVSVVVPVTGYGLKANPSEGSP